MGKVVPDFWFPITLEQIKSEIYASKHFEVWCVDDSVWEFKIGYAGLTKIEVSVGRTPEIDLGVRQVSIRMWAFEWEVINLDSGARLRVFTADRETIQSEMIASVFKYQHLVVH